MAHITKKQLLAGRVLKEGDTVNLQGLEYQVYSDHLFNADDGANCEAIDRQIKKAKLTLTEYEVAGAIYGHKTTVGDWPVSRYGGYAALSRLARWCVLTPAEARKALKSAEADKVKREKAEAAAKRKAQAKRAKELKALPVAARRVVLFFEDAEEKEGPLFGCQRTDVIRLASAIVGYDLSKVLKPSRD